MSAMSDLQGPSRNRLYLNFGMSYARGTSCVGSSLNELYFGILSKRAKWLSRIASSSAIVCTRLFGIFNFGTVIVGCKNVLLSSNEEVEHV